MIFANNVRLQVIISTTYSYHCVERLLQNLGDVPARLLSQTMVLDSIQQQALQVQHS